MDIVLAHVCISLLPLLVLTIMYIDACRDIHSFFIQRRVLRLLILLVWFVIVIDNLAWYLDGDTGPHMGFAVWLVNFIEFGLVSAIPYVWLLYVDAKLHGGGEMVHDRKRFAISMLPLTIYYIVLVSNPWTGLLFIIDIGNHYQRGPLYYIPYLLNLFFLCASVLLPLTERRHVRMVEQRRVCLYLALFSAIPLIGCVIQILNYDLWTAWPSSVLSLLLIYLMSQNQRFSEDSLTGLFNRGELDRYLLARHKSRNNAKWCFILMDVDDFKQINDLYGHAVGDEALQRTAGILKTVFGTYHAFLARYGGDEFSVVLDDKSQDEVEAILLQLTEEIQRRNADANRPYRLSISCGYAFHDAELNGDISRLVESADMMMYRNKQERKKLEQGELS